MNRDPWICEEDTLAERSFWAGEFSSVRTNAIVLSQVQTILGGVYSSSDVPEDFASLARARQLLKEAEYEAVELAISPALQSQRSYVRVMGQYYRSWATWASRGVLAERAEDTGIEMASQFGRAMAHQMLAWHRQRDFDFPGHLKAFKDAIIEFLKCDPIPVYWVAKTLVPLLHTAFEMADEEGNSLGRQAFHSIDWPSDLEHHKFDCLRALSRHAFLQGETELALDYIATAKTCQISPSCKAQALLHCASYAIELGERVWAREQLIAAEKLLNFSERDRSCPALRTAILSLALHYSDINVGRAKTYLSEYHAFQVDTNSAVAHDRRLDAVANIGLGKIGLALSPGDPYSLEVLERSYQIVTQYGFHYRAAIAASEIAGAQTVRKQREKWINAALMQIEAYGDKSPLRKLLNRKLEQTNLTAQEVRIRDMLLLGMSNKEIASALTLSAQSVRNRLSRIFRVYDVHTRGELIAKLGTS